jgi:uncharacterized membrane protein HdeD (DUF308 family)
MSTSGSAAADRTHAMMREIADHWGLVVLMGVASVVLGLLAIFFPGAALLTVAIYFAAWLFVSGVFSLIGAFSALGDTVSRVLTAVIGMLSIIVGFALLRAPFQSLEVFIFVLGVFWLAQGIMTLVAAFAHERDRGWRLVSGILGIVAGFIILVWPISSAVTLALVGGIWLVVLGITQIIGGLGLRRARSMLTNAHAGA